MVHISAFAVDQTVDQGTYVECLLQAFSPPLSRSTANLFGLL
jgi:hypothetical protein